MADDGFVNLLDMAAAQRGTTMPAAPDKDGFVNLLDMAEAQKAAQANTPEVAQPIDPAQAHKDRLAGHKEFAGDAMDFFAELASGGNRTALETLDFFGPGSINAINRLIGHATGNGPPMGMVPEFTDMGESLWNTGITDSGMKPGTARDAVHAAGSVFLPGAAAMKAVPRDPSKLGSIAADMTGFGSSKAVNPATGQATLEVMQGIDPPTGPTPIPKTKSTARIAAGNLKEKLYGAAGFDTKEKFDAALEIKRGSGAPVTAGWKVGKGGELVPDELANAVRRHNFSDGFVGMVKKGNAATRKAINDVVDNFAVAIKNPAEGNATRPHAVVGDRVVRRFDIVNAALERAGAKLKAAAKGLPNEEPFDRTPVLQLFKDKLDELKITVGPDGELDFSNSIINTTKGPQKFIRDFYNEVFRKPNPGAKDAHELKKWIDARVNYGKSKGNITDIVINPVKEVRHAINELLAEKFPDYGAVNAQVHELLGGIEELKDVAPNKTQWGREKLAMELGLMMRKTASNYQTAITTQYASETLDKLAQKYVKEYPDLIEQLDIKPGELDVDLAPVISAISEMEGILGTSAGNSLLGILEKASARRDLKAGRGLGDLAADIVSDTIESAKGFSEEDAIQDLKNLMMELDSNGN